MKKIILCLLLIFFSSSLYPLTLNKQDEAIIHFLVTSTPNITAAVSWYGGIRLARHLVTIPPTPTAEDYIAREALIHANPMMPIRGLGAYIVMPIGLGVLGFYQGRKWGNNLAAFYIAHKYKLPFNQALKVVTKYLLESGYGRLVVNDSPVKK